MNVKGKMLSEFIAFLTRSCYTFFQVMEFELKQNKNTEINKGDIYIMPCHMVLAENPITTFRFHHIESVSI